MIGADRLERNLDISALAIESATTTLCLSNGLVVTQTSAVNRHEWDDFATTCRATYLCSYGYVFGVALTHRMRFFTARLDNVKIAQCAVAQARLGRSSEFIDSIQIVPGFETYWTQIMQSILRALGPGYYRYGSIWNTDTPRQEAVALIPGVNVKRVVDYLVHVVDFSQWATWEAYERAVSTNVRRNVVKAVKDDPHLTLAIRYGIGAIRDVYALPRMRVLTGARKGLTAKGIVGVNRLIPMVRYAARTILFGQMAYTAKVIHHQRVAAYFAGIDFGLQTFYLDGASIPNNSGASWFLMLKMLHRVWKPDAKVLLGMYQPGEDWAGRDNILLSRRHLRAQELPCAMIWFRYD